MFVYSPYGDEAFSCRTRVRVVDPDNVAHTCTADRLHCGAAELVLALAEEVDLVYGAVRRSREEESFCDVPDNA